MLRVSEKKLRDFTARFIGSQRPVLAEHPRHDGSMAGFTDNYLRVNFAPRPELANTVVPVKLTAISDIGEESDGEVMI